MLLPDLSQLLSFSSSSSTLGGLFGAQTSASAGGLFGGLGTGAEGVGAEGGLFGGLLEGVLDELGLGSLEGLAEVLATDGENTDLEGAEFAVLQVTQVVTVVYEEFSILQASGVNFDDLNSVQALSAAYQELGLSPEEANSRAARLTIMFLLLDDRISTADLIGSLDGQLGGQQIGMTQQRAFMQIEQTIQAFSAASTGSQGQLSSLLEKGQSLLSGLSLASLRGAEGSTIVEGLGVGANAQNPDRATLESGLFGRVGEIFNRLADKAAQHPEGKELAAQLKEMAQATQNISRQVLQDGGLSSLQKGAALDPALQATSQQAVAAEVAKEQGLPGTERMARASERAQDVAADNADLGRSANDKTAEATNRAQPANNHSKPAALPEPPVPTYVVRPAANGGVEVVDPQTGEVIQVSTSTPSSTSSAANASENALAQSRGLETAQQVRLAQQIRVHVRTLAGHNGGQIVVGLNPKELGRVQVRLEITEGTVRGAITVQRADVAEAISRDLRALEQALQDVGLELAKDGIAIQIENQAAGSNGRENEAKEQNGTSFADTNSEALTADADTSEQASRWVNPDRLLDVEA